MFFCLRSRSRRAKLKFRSSYRERTVPSQFLRGIICRRRLLRRLCLRSLLSWKEQREDVNLMNIYSAEREVNLQLD